MILSDKTLLEIGPDIIDPFDSGKVRVYDGQPVISYGLSSAGYDITLADEFKRIKRQYHNADYVLDPKITQNYLYEDVIADQYIIPPNSAVLGRSSEYIKMPHNLITLCLGKSTYARLFVVANFTPLEPGWEGHITIELSNTGPLPVRVYAWEGIAQILFCQIDQAPLNDYGQGKYQGQTGVTTARI